GGPAVQALGADCPVRARENRDAASWIATQNGYLCALGADQRTSLSAIRSRTGVPPDRRLCRWTADKLCRRYQRTDRPVLDLVYGSTRSGNPNRVRWALRKAAISATRPSRGVRTSRPPGMYAAAASSHR